MFYIYIVKLCYNWVNGFWVKFVWFKCIYFGVVFGFCVLVYVEICKFVCFCCDLIYLYNYDFYNWFKIMYEVVIK